MDSTSLTKNSSRLRYRNLNKTAFGFLIGNSPHHVRILLCKFQEVNWFGYTIGGLIRILRIYSFRSPINTIFRFDSLLRSRLRGFGFRLFLSCWWCNCFGLGIVTPVGGNHPCDSIYRIHTSLLSGGRICDYV